MSRVFRRPPHNSYTYRSRFFHRFISFAVNNNKDRTQTLEKPFIFSLQIHTSIRWFLHIFLIFFGGSIRERFTPAVLHRIPDIMPFTEPEYDLENIPTYFQRNENAEKSYAKTDENIKPH